MSRTLEETPIAVIDLETTGLLAGGDRVVEVSLVRINPGEEPRLLLDTLINPERPMAATEIHGIRDEDVVDAPRFRDVAGELVRGLHGAILASFNVYFDAAFLRYELSRSGIDRLPPYICLMYLRPMLSLGTRCSLDDACRAHGIDHAQSHQAASDALSAAQLWSIYLDAARRSNIRTFEELARLKS
jgi:DNA polymerase-3 subunit epsilon